MVCQGIPELLVKLCYRAVLLLEFVKERFGQAAAFLGLFFGGFQSGKAFFYFLQFSRQFYIAPVVVALVERFPGVFVYVFLQEFFQQGLFVFALLYFGVQSRRAEQFFSMALKLSYSSCRSSIILLTAAINISCISRSCRCGVRHFCSFLNLLLH
jgi:hypothetical protein